METRSIRTLKLIAGWLCLDFANTLGMHVSEQTNEFLRSYFDLVEWSNYAGIITGDEERRLLRMAEENPTEAARVLQHAIELREIIFNIFSSTARNTAPPKKETAKFNKKLSQMMKHSKLEFKKSGVAWDVKKSEDSLDGMLNSVIQSAFMLLTSNELDRVKICADERGCGWLFFDHSKNRSRRWCDMTDCGNLAKQKRFYSRRHNKDIVLNPSISRIGILMKSRNIYEWSQERGYRIGIGGIDLLKNVNKELEQRKTRREIDPNFFEENLSFIRDLNDFEMKHPSSLIMVAVPRSAHIVSFEFDEKIIEMVLPPTYVGYRSLFETIRQDLEKHVFAGQVQVTTLSAPLKALASLLGVVSYGRNNLTYIPEFGSYFQLAGLLVNTPIPKTELIENNGKSVLSECANCSACIKVCPMGVINQDRFLIHAEKCYTLYSESLSPIPSEIHSPSPDCIIGCMKCQVVCPVNKGRLKYKNTGVSFSSKETHAILDSNLMNPKLSETIEAKFSTLGLSESSDILFRNFRNLMCNLLE